MIRCDVMRRFDVIRAGIVSHEIISEEMKKLQKLRIENKIPDTLIMVEHPEVVTIGPRARNDGVTVPDDYASSSIDRGGGITWHGPGQLVIYPIFHWNLDGESNVSMIINLIEDWIINSLRPLDIDAERDSRMQGVWYSGKKICSVGLHFLKWVSRHGFTINYNTPHGRVEGLAACGLDEGTTTSLSTLGKKGLTRDMLEAILLGKAPSSINREIGEMKKFE